MNKSLNVLEFFKIKQRIESCDVFYATLFNLADVKFSEKIQTACINFDKEGNTLNMEINPKFWNELNDDAKAFVVLHELYHVVFDHGKRIINLGGDFRIGNQASDIVINHHIHEKVGLNRELFDWKPYCWVETCFPKEKDVPTDMNFEYYYNKIYTDKNAQEQDLLGSHGNGEENNEENKQEGNTPSAESKDESDKKEEVGSIVESEDDFSPENFSDVFKDILEQNPEIAEEISKSPDFANLGDELKEFMPIHPELGKGHEGKKEDFKKLDQKPTFKKLMKLLVPKKKDINDDEVEMWVGAHRRYSAFLKQNKNILLPNTKEEEKFSGKDKKEVWIFMDSSGSCHGMFHIFSNIVMALLKEKGVNCRAFAFGDDCEEVDVKNHKISFYSGNDGGFDCIEEKIVDITRKEKIKYPDNVVVLSDGGVSFMCKDEVQKPDNWILLINNDYCKHLTPKGGKYFKIDNDFFGLKNNRFKM